MPLVSEPLPLGEQRARVLEYLRGVALPFTSVAGTIIEERLPQRGEQVPLRAALVLWACAACRGDESDALPVAAAFDLFGRFMLLHDELVAGDDAAAVSGAALARWGLGQSLNAGDALYALALRALADDVRDSARRLRVASMVTRAVLDAIEGRTRDVESDARGDGNGLLARVRSLRRRSANLTGAALEAGALVAGAPDAVLRGFRRAGRLLDAAGASDDAALSERIGVKAAEAIERCLPDRAQLGAFASVVGAVARRSA